jgi:hypothetical protein
LGEQAVASCQTQKRLVTALAAQLSFSLEFSHSGNSQLAIQPFFGQTDSFAGSPARGRIINEFRGMENFTDAAQVSASYRRGFFAGLGCARLSNPRANFVAFSG